MTGERKEISFMPETIEEEEAESDSRFSPGRPAAPCHDFVLQVSHSQAGNKDNVTYIIVLMIEVSESYPKD